MDESIEHGPRSFPEQFFSSFPLPVAVYTRDKGFQFKNQAWETTGDFTSETLSLLESRIKSSPGDRSGAGTETYFFLSDVEESAGDDAEGSVEPESNRRGIWGFLVTLLTPSEEAAPLYVIVAFDRSRQVSPDREFRKLRRAISGLENVSDEDFQFSEAGDDRVRRLLDGFETSVVLLDPDTYDLVDVNQKTTAQFDRKRSDLIGRNLKELYERDWETLEGFLDELSEEGEGCVDVLEGTTPEGVFPAVVEGTRVALPGRDVLLLTVKDITEESTMRKKLETQKNYLSNVLNTVPDIIVVLDHENRFTLVNEAAADFFGVDRDNMVGMKPADFFPEDQAESILREHRQLLETGEMIVREEQEVEDPKSGETKWFQQVKVVIDETKPVEDREVLVIARDITRRKDYEQKLEKSEKQFRLLAENIEELFWMTDPDKEEMLYLSPAAETILGRPRDELYERPDAWMESIHPEDHDRVLEALEDQKTGDYDEEYRIVRPDGEIRWIHDKAFPVEEDGTVTRIVGTAEDITERRELQRELEEQALYDQLTGLPNRTLFKDRLTMAIERCKRQDDWPVAILFFDLDQFKEVNDTYGHAFGDELLCKVSDRIKDTLRKEDTVARFGGDEFIVLLEDVEDLEDVKRFLERLQGALVDPFELQERAIQIKISIGVVLANEKHHEIEGLLQDADVAMFRAKKDPNTSVEIFADQMRREHIRQRALKRELNENYNSNQIQVHYQPIFDLRKDLTVGFEALVRWDHPDRGLLMPSEFLPLALESNLLPDLEWEIVRRVISLLQEHHSRFKETGIEWISVNLSRQYFFQSNAVQQILDELDRRNVNPGLLKIELSEKAAVKKEEVTQDNLMKMKQAGLLVAVDDFGTGYSSLRHLQSLPIDILKIDRSLVSKDTSIQKHENVLEAAVDLAHNMGMQSIAEGIETSGQRDLLKELGCDLGQGFFYDEALTREALVEKYL